MKKVTLLIAMAALVIFAGCKKEKETTGTTLKASIEQHKSNGSKTSLDPIDGAISWTAGDKILVNNGTSSVPFALTSIDGSTGKGTFSYNGEYEFGSSNVAVYPEAATVSGNKVTMTLSDELTYTGDGPLGDDANPMLGVFDDPDNLQLTSLCGVLGISLTGDNIVITAVEIVSNKTSDKLNGRFEVTDYTAAEPRLVTASDNSGTNKVKLNCNTTLTSTAKRFYFALPVGALSEGFTLNVYGDGADPIFSKPTVNATENYFTIQYNTLNTMPMVPVTLANTVDLSSLQDEFIPQDGDILTGTLANNVKISIAAGTTVTLRNANINESGTWTGGDYAGITCEGDATIILEGTNTVNGFNSTYPGVQAGPAGTTLTIEGSGTLNATGGSDGAAGIGSGMNASCGNITINGGTIVATGGPNGAGIGTGYTNAQGSSNISCGIITITGGTVTSYGGENAAGIGTGQSRHGTQIRRNECGGVNISGGMVTATGGENGAGIGSGYGRGTRYNPISYCGDINITGGTVVATGGSNGAGIGTGNTYTFGNSNCGNITITPGVTSVTATKGVDARDSIGRGKGNGTCGTVMFGDETIYDGSFWIIAPESGSAYGGLSFSITTVTNTDDTWVLQPE